MLVKNFMSFPEKEKVPENEYESLDILIEAKILNQQPLSPPPPVFFLLRDLTWGSLINQLYVSFFFKKCDLKVFTTYMKQNRKPLNYH